MSIVNDLNKINNIKHEIKNAIINKGVEMADNTPFADYPNKIDSIPDNYDNGYSNGYNDGYEEGSANGGGGDPTIENMWNLSTKNGTDYSYLFAGRLESELDMSKLDTSNVTNMRYMFYGCINLTSLDLSNFDTSNVTDMINMFYSCYKLPTLDISNFDMTKVTNAGRMFNGCDSLHTLRLDNCSNDTINMIIKRTNLPTNAIEGVIRTIYCKESEAAGLEAPTNWVFSYVD